MCKRPISATKYISLVKPVIVAVETKIQQLLTHKKSP